MRPTGSVSVLILSLGLACYVRPKPAHVGLSLQPRPRPVFNSSSEAEGRPPCRSVMVLATESSSANSEELLAHLEGHLIDGGLKVVSAAITGRVVSREEGDATGMRMEAAARLPPLERALVLAQNAKAKCVLQLLALDLGRSDRSRLYVWPAGTRSLQEVDEQTYLQSAVTRRWAVVGPHWSIDAKLIDVDSGTVLSIIRLSSSTPDVAQGKQMTLDEQQGQLVPFAGYHAWRLDAPDDRARLRIALMEALTRAIAGPVVPD